MSPKLIERILEWLFSANIKNQIIVQCDFESMLNHVQIWLAEDRIQLAQHLLSVLSVIILSHHACEINDTEISDEVLCRMKLRVLQNVQCVELRFPMKVSDRLINSVHEFVKVRNPEHPRPYVELVLVPVYKVSADS